MKKMKQKWMIGRNGYCNIEYNEEQGNERPRIHDNDQQHEFEEECIPQRWSAGVTDLQ